MLTFRPYGENNMVNSKNWSEDQIKQVWLKTAGQFKQYHKDLAGAWMDFSKYGDTSYDTNEGWEIDHIVPVSMGGSDNIGNLQAIHWKNNRTKSDNYPSFETAVSSTSNYNIMYRQSWTYKQRKAV